MQPITFGWLALHRCLVTVALSSDEDRTLKWGVRRFQPFVWFIYNVDFCVYGFFRLNPRGLSSNVVVIVGILVIVRLHFPIKRHITVFEGFCTNALLSCGLCSCGVRYTLSRELCPRHRWESVPSIHNALSTCKMCGRQRIQIQSPPPKAPVPHPSLPAQLVASAAFLYSQKFLFLFYYTIKKLNLNFIIR